MRKHIINLKLKKEGNKKMRKISLVLALSCVALLAMTSFAFAAHSLKTDGTPSDSFALQGDPTTQATWFDPNRNFGGSSSCNACHGLEDINAGTRGAYGSGPHGGYTTNSGKCTTCHTIHTGAYGMTAKKATNAKLLPGNTVTAVCNYCHDLTGTPLAPYSTRYLGADTSTNGINSGHYVEGLTPGSAMQSIRSADPNAVTNVYAALDLPWTYIPGGDASTGGRVTITADLFNKGSELSTSQGGSAFTCNSCHTPHAVNGSTVATYFGESQRIDISAKTKTSRLLKKNLIGTQNIATYGSAWCAGCHMGRNSMAGTNYNHKVNPTGLGYLTPAVLTAAGANAVSVTGKDMDGSGWSAASEYDTARTNAWYAMTEDDPLTGPVDLRPDGVIKIAAFPDGPSCQQCHASARDVEGSITAATIGTAGSAVYTGKPVTTFPHVSRTRNLLVEDGDDLCTNCHGLADLP